MKYSSTTRLINVVVFALLFCVFGVIAAYFGFFVCPDFFAVSHYTAQFSSVGIEQAGYFSKFPFVFPAALAVLGLAGFIASIVGLVHSIKALFDERNDDLVVKSFLSYVSIAYIVAVFFFVNAVLFYNVYGTGVTAWWIVICVIVTIAALIGGNVPMMKLLEEKNSNYLVSLIFNAMGYIGVSIFVVLLLPTIAVLSSKSVVYNLGLKLPICAVVGLVIGALGFAAGFTAKKAADSGKDSKLPIILGEAGLTVLGVFFIFSATYNYLFNENFNTYKKTWSNNWDLILTKGTGLGANKNVIPTDFIVMAYIIGILLVLAVIASVLYGVFGGKKKDSNKSAY